MLHIRIPIIVEGKYDKARLAQVVSAPIITTDGFGIFNNAEKAALIRRVGVNGVILLCDSDGGGSVIRSYLRGILAPELVYNLYVPQVAGKERRKRHGSKAGFLGVEGIDNGILADLFEKLADRHPEILAEQGSGTAETDPVENCCVSPCNPRFPEGNTGLSTASSAHTPITKTDLYFLGLTGGENSADKRDSVCARLGLPAGMTAGAFLAALNILYSKQELESLCAELSASAGE
ncbi:MAG: DUF4093 domain-containing protein [Clostridia bacterium]|nr:DUF4093 domain-containing protein [Clostridia bacterium]